MDDESALDLLANQPPWEWPEDAKDRLVAALHSDQPLEQRRLAAELLAHALDDAAAVALLERGQATGEDAELRATALIALGPGLEQCDIDGFEDPYAEPPFTERTFGRLCDALERIYRDAAAPGPVRRAALEAAVRAPRDWQRAAIRASWSSGDSSWRRTAVFCMGYVPGFTREVEEALESGEVELVHEVVRSSSRGLPEVAEIAEPVLLRFARSHEDTELQLDAITALASLSTEASLEVLEDLSGADDPEVADAAREALAIRGTDEGDELEW